MFEYWISKIGNMIDHECMVCRESFYTPNHPMDEVPRPSFMACKNQHTLCEKCIRFIATKGDRKCPKCGEEVLSGEIRSDFKLQNQLVKLHVQMQMEANLLDLQRKQAKVWDEKIHQIQAQKQDIFSKMQDTLDQLGIKEVMQKIKFLHQRQKEMIKEKEKNLEYRRKRHHFFLTHSNHENIRQLRKQIEDKQYSKTSGLIGLNNRHLFPKCHHQHLPPYYQGILLGFDVISLAPEDVLDLYRGHLRSQLIQPDPFDWSYSQLLKQPNNIKLLFSQANFAYQESIRFGLLDAFVGSIRMYLCCLQKEPNSQNLKEALLLTAFSIFNLVEIREYMLGVEAKISETLKQHLLLCANKKRIYLAPRRINNSHFLKMAEQCKQSLQKVRDVIMNVYKGTQ